MVCLSVWVSAGILRSSGSYWVPRRFRRLSGRRSGASQIGGNQPVRLAAIFFVVGMQFDLG
jgi:hypothetical protein